MAVQNCSGHCWVTTQERAGTLTVEVLLLAASVSGILLAWESRWRALENPWGWATSMYRASLPAFNGPHLELIIRKLLDPFTEVFSYLVLFLQWLTLLALFPGQLFSVCFPCNWWTGNCFFILFGQARFPSYVFIASYLQREIQMVTNLL